MKRVIRGLVVLLWGYMALVSEGSAQSPVFFGVRGGVVYSNPSFPTGYVDHSHRTGLTLGGLIGYRVSGSFAVVLEVNDVQKGANFLVFQQYKESLFAEVLEFPLLLQARATTGPVSFYLEGGPALAMKLWEKYNPNPHVTHTANIRTYYSDNELAAVIGAGMTYRVFGALSVFASARYSHGVSVIDRTLTEQIHSSEVTIATGVLFNRQ